jgi:hypothetical protein
MRRKSPFLLSLTVDQRGELESRLVSIRCCIVRLSGLRSC